MTFVPNTIVLDEFLMSPTGRVGIFVAVKGFEVQERAYTNASGEVINVRSDDLRGGLKAVVDPTPLGPVCRVGTDAQHRSFPYPQIVTRAGGEPGGWLKQALREVFPNARTV